MTLGISDLCFYCISEHSLCVISLDMFGVPPKISSTICFSYNLNLDYTIPTMYRV